MSLPRARRRALSTWLVLAAVALVATVAALDAVRGGSSPDSESDRTREPMLTGELVPPEGRLDGTLVFVTLAGCRSQTLDLETLALGPPGPPLDCGLWVPPAGELAAVSLEPALALRGSRLALLELGEPPRLGDELGVARGEPAWSRDGSVVAWCTADGETVVLTPETGERVEVAGCRPSITPDGSVLTRSAAPLASTLFEDGDVLLRRADLLRAFPPDSDGPLDLVGYDVRSDGLLAVVAVRFEAGRRPRRLLELWRDGRLVDAILLPELTLPAGAGRLGDRVVFDPTGEEVAVSYPGAGTQMAVVDLATGEVVVGPINQHGFAWSPDGMWLAISTGEEIRVHGPDRDQPEYVLPVGAAAIAWR
jgi:WD40-like Beta Propeller Repeat